MTAAGPATTLVGEHCRALSDHPELSGDTTVLDIVAQCEQPLRVLLVGDVSTGKSTLLNALIGRPLARTAFEETTSAVTWYHTPALGTPVLPALSHRAVAAEFPLADRIMLGDSPGLNTPSDNPRETLRMMGGGDLCGAAAAFACVLSGGRVDHWAGRLEGLAAFSAGPFDLVGNVVAVMAKIEYVDEDIDGIERRVHGDTPVTFRFTGVNQLMAAGARNGAVGHGTIAVLDALRALPSFTSWAVPSWPRVRDELAEQVPVERLKAFEATVGGPAWLPELVRATKGMDDPAKVAEVFERVSRIRTLEAVLADIADDADLFTTIAALTRLRRLAAGLADGPAERVRSVWAAIQDDQRYKDLYPRAAARLLRHTPVGDGLEPDALATALGLLLGRPLAPDAVATALTHWSARVADPFTDSRARVVAELVADTARRSLDRPEPEEQP